MADLVDKSGSAGSNLVQGTGTATATFALPGSVQIDVESVVATIDNTAGGATTPTLVVRDSSGEVIATKRMGDTIPAGDTGTATFSLRNSDDAQASVVGATATALYANFAQPIPAGGGFPAGLVSFSLISGAALLDLVTNGADTPTVITAGVYALSVTASPSGSADPIGSYIHQVNLDCNTSVASTSSNQAPGRNNPAFTDVVGVANSQAFAAGDTLDVFIADTFTLGSDYGVSMVVQQLS